MQIPPVIELVRHEENYKDWLILTLTTSTYIYYMHIHLQYALLNFRDTIKIYKYKNWYY